MKKAWVLGLLFLLSICFSTRAEAQCAMCTKTAQQLGEKPAQGMNAGILYKILYVLLAVWLGVALNLNPASFLFLLYLLLVLMGWFLV